MDRQEAAELLGVSPSTVTRWVRQGLLRASADGTRFERAELERWARRTGISLGGARRGAAPIEEDLLAGAVRRGAVLPPGHPTSALEAIELAVAGVPGLSAPAKAHLMERVTERERMASTALGGGVALPHPRKPPAEWIHEPTVVVLPCEQPVDWAALDDQPVHTVLLLLSPSASVHLELLSRVAFALRAPGFGDFLGTRPSQEELVRRLEELRRDG